MPSYVTHGTRLRILFSSANQTPTLCDEAPQLCTPLNTCGKFSESSKHLVCRLLHGNLVETDIKSDLDAEPPPTFPRNQFPNSEPGSQSFHGETASSRPLFA